MVLKKKKTQNNSYHMYLSLYIPVFKDTGKDDFCFILIIIVIIIYSSDH